MHIPHIPLGDEECLQVFGGLDVRWLYQFKERFQTRADVIGFIEQVIKSTGKTKLETITKQVRPRNAFEGVRCNLVDALFVEGSEVNRFERDNLLNQPLPLQEQPAHDSLENPGGIDESKHLKTIALLLRYIENNLKRKQAVVATELSEGEQYKVRGLGQTNLNVIFSKANKELSK
jgi:hypothetical protein